MTGINCGQPISWLTLELYNLNELPEQESRRVARHLSNCPVCQRCQEVIEGDEGLTLKPLPAAPMPRQWGWRPLKWATAGGVLALAAMLLVIFRPPPPEGDLSLAPPRISYKGGELALSLVRQRSGQIMHNPSTFAAGDRFQVQLTCPPSKTVAVSEVVVFQQGKAYFPLQPSGTLACGNLVPLAGAFQLTGRSQASVCVVVEEQPPDRALLSSNGPGALPPNSVCVSLKPVIR